MFDYRFIRDNIITIWLNTKQMGELWKQRRPFRDQTNILHCRLVSDVTLTWFRQLNIYSQIGRERERRGERERREKKQERRNRDSFYTITATTIFPRGHCFFGGKHISSENRTEVCKQQLQPLKQSPLIRERERLRERWEERLRE